MLRFLFARVHSRSFENHIIFFMTDTRTRQLNSCVTNGVFHKHLTPCTKTPRLGTSIRVSCPTRDRTRETSRTVWRGHLCHSSIRAVEFQNWNLINVNKKTTGINKNIAPKIRSSSHCFPTHMYE